MFLYIFSSVVGVVVLIAIVSTIVHIIVYDKTNGVMLVNHYTAYENNSYDPDQAETNVDDASMPNRLSVNGVGPKQNRANGSIHVSGDNESCKSEPDVENDVSNTEKKAGAYLSFFIKYLHMFPFFI